MTGYPESPGYQAHSETSRAAAARLTDASTLRRQIKLHLRESGQQGHTADEIARTLGIQNSTIAARLRELELDNQVIKTTVKRKTRFDRDAFVYVLPIFHREELGRANVKSEPPRDIVRLEAEHARMKEALEQFMELKKQGIIKGSSYDIPLMNRLTVRNIR
ncbi:MAG: hypothetical protein ACPGQQ_02740 [Candidatus Puniceispirillaceae bacterium]